MTAIGHAPPLLSERDPLSRLPNPEKAAGRRPASNLLVFPLEVWHTLKPSEFREMVSCDPAQEERTVKSIILMLGLLLALPAVQPSPLRGWLSDEACARGRAESGAYTGTNPECAKRCVSEGKKIVFIDPKGRRVLDIENQEAARSDIGDEVEITGPIDAKRGLVHIDSMKLIARGSAMCGRTSHSK